MNDFFDGLWNKAQGLFDSWIDLESFKVQSDLALNQFKAQKEVERAYAPATSSSTSWTRPGEFPWGTVALVGGGLAVAFLIARK